MCSLNSDLSIFLPPITGGSFFSMPGGALKENWLWNARSRAALSTVQTGRFAVSSPAFLFIRNLRFSIRPSSQYKPSLLQSEVEAIHNRQYLCCGRSHSLCNRTEPVLTPLIPYPDQRHPEKASHRFRTLNPSFPEAIGLHRQ